jgi:hypothetical protein
MKHETSLVQMTQSGSDKRRYKRKHVLLGAVVATTNGTDALDCIIRNLSARGASVHSSMDLSVGDEIFLLNTRNHIAYLATIKWRKWKGAGVEFIRTYDLNSTLPPEMVFLEKLLIEAKLRQISILESRGIELEHAASIVGLNEKHLSRVDDHSGIVTQFGALIDRLLPFVETGVLSSKRIPMRGGGRPKFSLFQRRPQQ